ncbi:MAG: zinc dependent phospholipase C family protein [bacterium]|nr:zinc dependent phospholipase C family protein [bacterium]
MKTIDHYKIGKKIAENMSKQTTSFQRKLFLIGCVEPDINLFTYLKGSLHLKKFHGHNYENACKVIKGYVSELNAIDRWSNMYYYKMGKLIHYAADAFTFPHNSQFKESLKAHIEYEDRLHQLFEESIELKAFILERRDQKKWLLMQKFQELHQMYLDERETIKDDIRYICHICKYLSSELLPGIKVYEKERYALISSKYCWNYVN